MHDNHRRGRGRRPVRRGAVFAVLAILTLAWSPTARAEGEEVVFVPRYDQPAAAGSNALDRRLLRFMTTDDFVPLNFRDRLGETSGFNVALARAICDVLDIACSMQVVPWEQLEFRLLAQGGDVVLAGHRVSGRTDGLIETRPYLANPARFVVRGDASRALSTPVGVLEGSAHGAYLAAFLPERPTRAFATNEALWAALVAGEVEEIFTDALSASVRLAGETGQCCAFRPGAYTETRYFGEGLTMLLRPEDQALADAIEAATVQVIEDGTFAELYLRHFPLGLY